MNKPRLSRRTLLAACPGSLAATGIQAERRVPPIAAVVTEYRKFSHAQNIVDRFLEGYGWESRHHRPAVQVVSLYVDQTRENDLSRERAARVPGLRIFRSIAEALTLGGEELGVDGVLLIGEHGTYPANAKGQTLYPRYEFFRQIVDVFRRSGRAVPVFNDKHLSWSWEQAAEMVKTAKELGFPLMAGSSLPVTWRIPSRDLPWGAEVEEAVVVGPGGVDSYDFHALEAVQCLVERRHGGEKGVSSLQAYRGEQFWQAVTAGSADGGGWDPALFTACLCRSFMLKPSREGFSHIYPTVEDMRRLTPSPVAYRYSHLNGPRVSMLLMDGLVDDITVAIRLKGESEPLSMQMYLGAGHQMHANFFNPLVRHLDTLFTSGRVPYPIERTLLTTGLVAAGVESLSKGGARIPTPHLTLRYRARRLSSFRKS